MILGVDFGSSYTDAVLMSGENVKKCTTFGDERLDMILFKLASVKIDKIVVTGAHSKDYGYKIKGIPVRKVNEISAIGLGGMYVGKKKEALVISVGGTAMVSCKDGIKHIGGTPIGGKTLTGLAKLLIGTDDLGKIEKLAKLGDLSKVDLQLKEIYPEGIGLLPPSATASHFGKLGEYKIEDVALGLLNMVAQTVGTLAVFGAKAYGHKDIILTGRLSKSKIFQEIIKNRINSISCVPVVIPKNSEYATAIGAVIGNSLGI